MDPYDLISTSDENECSLDSLLLDPEAQQNEIIETSPTNRYCKFAEIIEKTALKTSYRALDNELGCEVLWTEISLAALTDPEISLLSKIVVLNRNLQHKHIKEVKSCWMQQHGRALIMISEIISGGSLFEYLNRLPQSNTKLVKIWGKGILQGLQYLHSKGPEVVHGGLTSKSIKIRSSDGAVKIANFFVSQLNRSPFKVEEPWFCAPETLEGSYTQKSDIYSFGMILLEMATQCQPYHDSKTHSEIWKKKKDKISPREIEKVSNNLIRTIIEKCISDPDDRPTASDLLNSSFFLDEKEVEREVDESFIKNICLIVLDSNRVQRSVSFEFNTQKDTPEKVALEMVESFQMDKTAFHTVCEEIKKKLFTQNIDFKTLPSQPVLKCSYSFDDFLLLTPDLLKQKIAKLLSVYYRCPDSQLGNLIKRFQIEVGLAPNGDITEQLYKLLNSRIRLQKAKTLS